MKRARDTSESKKHSECTVPRNERVTVFQDCFHVISCHWAGFKKRSIELNIMALHVRSLPTSLAGVALCSPILRPTSPSTHPNHPHPHTASLLVAPPCQSTLTPTLTRRERQLCFVARLEPTRRRWCNCDKTASLLVAPPCQYTLTPALTHWQRQLCFVAAKALVQL